MIATRTQLRAAARAAVDADAHFADFTRWSGWGGNRGESDLPAIDLATPRFQPQVVAVGKLEETVDLVVVVRRGGSANLEDDLDDDLTAIEAAILPALRGLCDEAVLASGETDVPGLGQSRIATGVLTFRCTLLSNRAAL